MCACARRRMPRLARRRLRAGARGAGARRGGGLDRAVWRGLDGAGLGRELLETLTRGRSLTGVAPFALVVAEGDGVHVAVRGDVELVAGRDAFRPSPAPARRRGWSGSSLRRRLDVVLPVESSAPGLPVRDGVVAVALRDADGCRGCARRGRRGTGASRVAASARPRRHRAPPRQGPGGLRRGPVRRVTPRPPPRHRSSGAAPRRPRSPRWARRRGPGSRTVDPVGASSAGGFVRARRRAGPRPGVCARRGRG